MQANLLESTIALASLALGQAAPVPPGPAAIPAPPAPARIVEPSERRDDAALADALRRLAAAHPGRAEVREGWKSAGGTAVRMLCLADPVADADRRPAFLLIAGMDGERWATTEAALVAAESLLADRPAALREVTVYLVACANPDARARFLAGPRRADARDASPRDDDRDGRLDEDAPRDLDGDGAITQMRVANPRAPWPPAGSVPDPAAPRLMRTPDRAAGQLPSHLLLTEGIDADGDGAIGEDGPGGVDPERNFPHRWPEFAADAGAYPLSAPEARGIAEFVIGRPNLFAAAVLGRHDTAVNRPDPKARTPGGMPEMLDPKDADAHGALAKAWIDASGQKRAEGADAAGSLVAWLNAQRGLVTVATTLWGRPDPAEDPAAKAKPAEPAPADPNAAAWLVLSDASGGAGFVPWKPFEHPQLGRVEVGGWLPGYRENPPVTEVAALGGKAADFLSRAAKLRPAVILRDVSASSLGPGTWRVEATVANTGALPTALQGGRTTNVAPAHVVRVSVPVDRVLSGQRMHVLRGIDAGEARRLEWIVAAGPGEAITVDLSLGGTPLASASVRDGLPATAGSTEEAK